MISFVYFLRVLTPSWKCPFPFTFLHRAKKSTCFIPRGSWTTFFVQISFDMAIRRPILIERVVQNWVPILWFLETIESQNGFWSFTLDLKLSLYCCFSANSAEDFIYSGFLINFTLNSSSVLRSFYSIFNIIFVCACGVLLSSQHTRILLVNVKRGVLNVTF